MLMWLVEHTILNLPPLFWLILACLGLVAFFFASIFSHIPPLRPYMMFVKPVGGIIVLCSVFMYGGTTINDHWQEKVKEAEGLIEQKKQEADAANDKLVAEQKAKEAALARIDVINKEAANKLDKLKKEMDRLRGLPAEERKKIIMKLLTPEELKKYESMTAEEKVKFEDSKLSLAALPKEDQEKIINMSDKERQEYETRMKELADHPNIPKLVMQQYNQAIKNFNDSKQKGDKK